MHFTPSEYSRLLVCQTNTTKEPKTKRRLCGKQFHDKPYLNLLYQFPTTTNYFFTYTFFLLIIEAAPLHSSLYTPLLSLRLEPTTVLLNYVVLLTCRHAKLQSSELSLYLGCGTKVVTWYFLPVTPSVLEPTTVSSAATNLNIQHLQIVVLAVILSAR